MPNRIYRKIARLEDGKERTSRQIISKFLIKNNERTLGEIKKDLAEHSIAYRDNRGLLNILESMIKSGEIGKHKIPGKSYNTYYYKKQDLSETSYIGDEFSRAIPSWLYNYPQIPEHRSESDEMYFVRRLVRIFGIYALFVLIQSWKCTKSSKSHSENYDIRKSWLRETLPFPSGTNLLDETMNDLIHAGSHELRIAKPYANQEKMQKLLDLEKTLLKKYPQETKLFLDCLDKAKSEFKETRKWIKDMERLNAWQERLNKKMKKNPKKLKKLNECPRCHYDGSTKVKYGPCKGMIFRNGFVLESGIEQQGRHCPACGFWEYVKNS
jgi:hypothetical protein